MKYEKLKNQTEYMKGTNAKKWAKYLNRKFTR